MRQRACCCWQAYGACCGNACARNRCRGLLGLGALAALGLAAGLLLRWDRKWQRAALCGALLVLLAAGILLRSHISAALAGLGDLWGQWRFQQTRTVHAALCGGGQRLVDACCLWGL